MQAKGYTLGRTRPTLLYRLLLSTSSAGVIHSERRFDVVGMRGSNPMGKRWILRRWSLFQKLDRLPRLGCS
jgi:hypothetical protein